MDVIALEQMRHLPAYAKLPLCIERGEGCWVYTAEGGKYLDLYGGHAVATTGHCHPRIVARLKAQAETLIFYSNIVYTSSRAHAAARLCDCAPDGFDSVFFVNSGAEANENALKLARHITGRNEIVSFEGGFHGRTWAAFQASLKKVDGTWRSTSRTTNPHAHPIKGSRLAATTGVEQIAEDRSRRDSHAIVESPEVLTGVPTRSRDRVGCPSGAETAPPSPLDERPVFRILPFGDIVSAQQAITSRTAAVIIEPIQSLAGVRMAQPEFYQELRARCDATGAVLIYDEVQTGCGRTGDFFFAPRFGVMPDIITLAKGMASGIPMGAVVVRKTIASDVSVGDLGSTFGGGPLACAALDETLAIIQDERLLDNVKQTSAFVVGRLTGLPLIAEIRGLGFLLGLRLTVPARAVRDRLLEHKIIAGLSDDPFVLRLLPPLTLTEHEAEIFVQAFGEICRGH